MGTHFKIIMIENDGAEYLLDDRETVLSDYCSTLSGAYEEAGSKLTEILDERHEAETRRLTGKE